MLKRELIWDEPVSSRQILWARAKDFFRFRNCASFQTINHGANATLQVYYPNSILCIAVRQAEPTVEHFWFIIRFGRHSSNHKQLSSGVTLAVSTAVKTMTSVAGQQRLFVCECRSNCDTRPSMNTNHLFHRLYNRLGLLAINYAMAWVKKITDIHDNRILTRGMDTNKQSSSLWRSSSSSLNRSLNLGK